MSHTIEITPQSNLYIGNMTTLLAELLPEKRVIVISDSTIDRLQHSAIAPYERILVGQGESAKSLVTLDAVYRRLIDMEADRECFILGVGGGVVTDIAGFVASTYMRGVEFGFVTTTLLGAVDASVGGKNGVNIGGFKNMVGTFSQPRFVICDVELFATLSERDFRAGLGEVIKSAIIGDKQLFELLERSSVEVLRSNKELLSEVVERSIRVKAAIVAKDPCEGGLRRLLNLGHTIAHAIEKSTNALLHGEAVAVGLCCMVRYAVARSLMSASEGDRVLKLLDKYGFATAIPASKRELLEVVRSDKKRTGDAIHLIIPTAIGAVEDRVVDFTELGDLL